MHHYVRLCDDAAVERVESCQTLGSNLLPFQSDTKQLGHNTKSWATCDNILAHVKKLTGGQNYLQPEASITASTLGPK